MSIREEESGVRVASTTQAQEVMAAKKPTPLQVWVCLNILTKCGWKNLHLLVDFQ